MRDEGCIHPHNLSSSASLLAFVLFMSISYYVNNNISSIILLLLQHYYYVNSKQIRRST